MSQMIEAIYENGVFRPLEADKLNLAEGQQVRVSLSGYVADPREVEESLKEVTSILDGLSPEEIEEFESVALDRSQFFSPRSDS